MLTGAKGVDRAGEVMNTISSTMSASEIIAILTGHRCGDITGELDLDRCGRSPISGGGFGDVYQGTLKGGEKVVIKCARLYLQQDDVSGYKILKRAARELHTWSRLEHENIVSLLGLAQFRDQMAMVSAWMDNGTLLHYITRYPAADRYQLCSDISDGVAYLHQNGTCVSRRIHGDIKGVSKRADIRKGVAKLADFGCTEMNSSSLHFTTTTNGVNISMRWAAPEMLTDQETRSKEADVYALGMTFLETITGKVPFSNKNDRAVYIAVAVKLQIPDRPLEFPSFTFDEANQLWEIIVSSCAHNPLDRPGSTAIQNRVRNIRQHAKRMLHHYSTTGSDSSTTVKAPASKKVIYDNKNPADPFESRDGYDLLAPDRRPNQAHPYVPFEEFFVVEDLSEILQPQPPPLPTVLVSHDVTVSEWDRCMVILVRFASRVIRSAGSSVLDPLLDFVTQWNIGFFLPRGVDLGVYKGNTRRSGPASMINIKSKLRVLSKESEGASGARRRKRSVSVRLRAVVINLVAGSNSGTAARELAGKEAIYDNEDSANPLEPRNTTKCGKSADYNDNKELDEQGKSKEAEESEDEDDREEATSMQQQSPRSGSVSTAASGYPSGARQGKRRVGSMDTSDLLPGIQVLQDLLDLRQRWQTELANAHRAAGRKVKSLLNVLTTGKFDSISDQIIEWVNRSEQEKDGSMLMRQDVRATLPKDMERVSPNIQDETVRSAEGQPVTGGLLFRKYLLSQCQKGFECRRPAKGADTLAAGGGGGDKTNLQSLGFVQFIGELYKQGMLTERIMHDCIKKLLSNAIDPGEEEIESLCELFRTAGRDLDTSNARTHMDVYFERMQEMARVNRINSRMRFKLQDIIELRHRYWQARSAIAQPSTINAVHGEAKRGGSHRGGHRGGGYGRQRGGRNVAGGTSTTQPLAEATDLPPSGKLSRSAGLSFGSMSMLNIKDPSPYGAGLARASSFQNILAVLGVGGPSQLNAHGTQLE
ncbi:hypothetical protein FRC12_009198 [Ceratobasidium sp. 428]|nr:hypothetical protein FRC12_009198 [Ceratobasidium sp. 428]